MKSEYVLILTEATMIERVSRWASRHDFKISPMPVMKRDVPLSFEVLDDSYAHVVYDEKDHMVYENGVAIGYWTISKVVSAQEGKTCTIIQPIGY